MVDGLSLEVVGQVALAVFLALLPIAVAYFANERSKRRDFERDRKYDRKREHYERALSALRSYRESREMLEFQTVGEAILKSALPAEEQQNAAAAWKLLKILVEMVFAAKSSTTREELERSFETLRESTAPEHEERLDTATFAAVLFAWTRAESDLERAISGLELLGSPEATISEIRSIWERIQDHKVGEGTWDWFDDSMSDVTATIREDLQATIKGK